MVRPVDPTEIRAWIGRELETAWPEAECTGHDEKDGDLHFHIDHAGRLHRLIVPIQRRQRIGTEEVTQVLRAEHWLHRLPMERCLKVYWRGIRPSLVRPPEPVM